MLVIINNSGKNVKVIIFVSVKNHSEINKPKKVTKNDAILFFSFRKIPVYKIPNETEVFRNVVKIIGISFG